ncbi:hypothetical protein J7E18_04395 [Oceanobacillus sp. ISL-73]|nr:hypothetical protein [Oceanobacillus sp. ISL-74]MBT2651106.1 hypothetical protein [Oceanobacillus sp. ISL-73]
MTFHPFPQLDVIQKASQKGRILFDCYRLLYKEDFWQIVIRRLNLLSYLQNSIVNNMIKEIIYELRIGKFRFSNTSKLNNHLHTKDSLVKEAVVVILEHIYPMKGFDQSSLPKTDPSFFTLQKLITWDNMKWFIKISFDKIIYSEQFIEFVMTMIKGKVNDHRFIQLVFYASMMSQQKHCHTYTYPMSKLANLIKYIFQESIVQNIQDIIKRNNDSPIKLVYNRAELLIGINDTKPHALSLLREINDELVHGYIHFFCNIQLNLYHIGDNIDFQKYQLLPKGAFGSNPDKNQRLRLIVPKKQMNQWVSRNEYGDLQKYISLARRKLLYFSDQRILRIYNEELISFANHYVFAANFNDIEKIVHLAESSFLKTLAFKYKTTSKQIAFSLKQKNQHGRVGLVCKSNFHIFIKMHHLKLYRKKILQIISNM